MNIQDITVRNNYNEDILQLKTVEDIATYYAQECVHPLVGVFDILGGKNRLLPRAYGTYSIIFNNYSVHKWGYGRNSTISAVSGSVLTLGPGQFMRPTTPVDYTNCGIALYFSPGLIHGTRLGTLIWTYRFIDYKFNQSLFLTDSERVQFLRIMQQLKKDLSRYGENLNLFYIIRLIEMMMDILVVAYKRMADCYRKNTDDIYANFEDELHNYLLNYEKHERKIPSVAYFAEKAGLTHSHFSEAMKDTIMMNAHEYITQKMLDIAREWLVQNREAREVARRLGFSDAPHFTRFYYNACGELPSVYKRARMKLLKTSLSEFVDDTGLNRKLANLAVPEPAPQSIY